jgi:uncharacterized repeat protein (TIGR01451 family)
LLPAHSAAPLAQAPPNLVEAAQGGRALSFKRRFGLRPRIAGLTTTTALVSLLVFFVAGALAVSGAAFTSTNPAADNGSTGDPALCLNGGAKTNTLPANNCNIYTDKAYVWLNGGPDAAALEDGIYFFTVLVPGGKNSDTNDAGTVPDDGTGTDKNLSDDYDNYLARTFSIENGVVTNLGSHDFENGMLRLAPYSDTTNNGDEYTVNICKLGALGTAEADYAYPIDDNQSECKSDNFKVFTEGVTTASDLTAIKDAAPTFTQTYGWNVKKVRTSSSPVNTSSSTATVSYKVTATWSGPTDSAWQVKGQITVTNPSEADAVGVQVTDKLSTGGALTDVIPGTADTNATCSVTEGGNPIPLAGTTVDALGAAIFDYTCTWAANTSPIKSSGAYVAYTNNAHVTWDNTVNPWQNTVGFTDATAGVTWGGDSVNGNPTVANACNTVTDTFGGGSPTTLGTVCANGTSSGLYSGNSPLSNFVASYNIAPFTASNPAQTWTFTYNRSVAVVPNACTTYYNTAGGTVNSDTTDDTASVSVCARIANGFTLGFWSNNNGRAVLCAHDQEWRNIANASNLKKQNGTAYTVPLLPTNCNTAQANFATWILAANATNMSYMLSAQLIATTYDVAYKGMLGTACVAGINGSPIKINSLIAAAVAFLGANPNTTASGAARNTATLYKNIFDGLNNNLVFAVPGPC